MSRRSSQSGASLIELLVALSVLAAIAVLSAQLVIQSTKLIDTAARASHNPDLLIATQWLRRDLYEAGGVAGLGTGWKIEPMVVTAQHGGWITYAFIDGRLLRTAVTPGIATDTRVVLNGVTGWRWRVQTGGLAETEIKMLANPHAHQNLTGAASYRIERRTERLAFALRGQPGGAGW